MTEHVEVIRHIGFFRYLLAYWKPIELFIIVNGQDWKVQLLRGYMSLTRMR